MEQKEIKRKLKEGLLLTEGEQAVLCSGCFNTGDAVWVGGRFICQRRACKHTSSRKSRYFRERIR